MKHKNLIAKVKTWILSALVAMILFGSLFMNSMAWLPISPSTFDSYTINADGYLYVAASAETSTNVSAATPAIAMPGAVAAGQYMDVLRLYNPADTNPSYISQTATLSTAQCNIRISNDKCEVYNVYLRKAFAGYVDCSNCHGLCYTTVDSQKNECTICNGFGKVNCSVCFGVIRCETCDGTGKDGNNTCSACNGTGIDKCERCNGSGAVEEKNTRVVCPVCRGSKVKHCPNNCGYWIYPMIEWEMDTEDEFGNKGLNNGKYLYYDWNAGTQIVYERDSDGKITSNFTTYTIKGISTKNSYNDVYDWTAPLSEIAVVDWREIAWNATKYYNSSEYADGSPSDFYDGIPHRGAIWTITPGFINFNYSLSGSLLHESYSFDGLMDESTNYFYDVSTNGYLPIFDNNGDIIWNNLDSSRKIFNPNDWAKDFQYVKIDERNQVIVSYRLHFKETNDLTKNDYFDDKEFTVSNVRVYNSMGEARTVIPVDGNNYINATFESYQTEIYTIWIEYYITYPDELVDPKLINGTLYVYVEISAQPVVVTINGGENNGNGGA